MITQSVTDCWYLTGTTAVGKTKIGIALAQCLDAEIISLDSMAIYRGMNIGTAKPTSEQQGLVAHHLIDIIDPDQSFSVAQYLKAAHAKWGEIRMRGRNVLFVGGTPLYLKSLLRGLFEGPPANWQVRTEIERELAQVEASEGNRVLHTRLESIDPVAASQIHPHDTRRLIRALEVYRITGQPISHQQLQFDDGRPADQCRVFVLRRPGDEGRQRIDARVDAMIARGLVDEVKGLTRDGWQLGRTASQAVGYREVLDYVAGHLDAEVMVEKIKSRTRRFAKRQRTWFRSLSECRFVDIAGEVKPEEVATRIVEDGLRASPNTV
jgi:tRNA dimethylallyltransferase